MKYLKELYIYNKKSFIIGFIIFILLLGSLIYLTNTKDNDNNNISNNNHNNNTNDNPTEVKNYDLVLFGSQEVTIYKNEKYQEPGYYAILNNQIVTDEVIIVNLVDTTKLGIYEITYTIGNIKKTRIVKVIENPKDLIENNKLSLIGDEKIILYVGEIYNELGCLAYDKDNKDISNKVSIKGNVNTNVHGTYYITYSISENGKIKSIKREIVVKEKLAISLDYSKTYTNQDLVININASGSDFSYIRLPDGTISQEKKTTYKIKENGTYNFYVFDKNNNHQVQTIKINNIDKQKPTATCNAKVYPDKTEINVNATDNLGIDKYVYNKSYVSKQTSYTINSKLNTLA